MAQKRLSMRKIEEILRLKYEKKLTHRAIAQACSVSSSTVSEYITHAKAAGLSWPLPEGLGAVNFCSKHHHLFSANCPRAFSAKRHHPHFLNNLPLSFVNNLKNSGYWLHAYVDMHLLL